MNEQFLKSLLKSFLLVDDDCCWKINNGNVIMNIRRFGEKVNCQVVDKDNNITKGYWLLPNDTLYMYTDHM
jgi:hypothetical protein